MKGPNKLRERCDTEGDALLDLFKKDLAPLSNGRAFGLWGFRYVHSTASLVTFLFSPKRKRREQEQIEEEPIRDGYGSISQVLEDLDVVFIADTASDPRGVVVQTDMQIGQRSACLFPVFGGAPGGRSTENLLMVLDFFCDEPNFFGKPEVKNKIRDIRDDLERETGKLGTLLELCRGEVLLDCLTRPRLPEQVTEAPSYLSKPVRELLKESFLPPGLVSIAAKAGVHTDIWHDLHVFVIEQSRLDRMLHEKATLCFLTDTRNDVCCFRKNTTVGDEGIHDKSVCDYFVQEAIRPFLSGSTRTTTRIDDEYSVVLFADKGKVFPVNKVRQVLCQAQQDIDSWKAIDKDNKLLTAKYRNEKVLECVKRCRIDLDAKLVFLLKQIVQHWELIEPQNEGHCIARHCNLKNQIDNRQTNLFARMHAENLAVESPSPGNCFRELSPSKTRDVLLASFVQEAFCKSVEKALVNKPEFLSALTTDLCCEKQITLANEGGISIAMHCGVMARTDRVITKRLEHEIDYVLSVLRRTAAEHAMRRSALAALMARNLSHNVGSHILANPLLQKIRTKPEDVLDEQHQEACRIKDDNGNLKTDEEYRKVCDHLCTSFDAYVQMRTDFISQIVEDSSSAIEPCFCWQDIIKPFTEQWILLTTLVADQGYGYGKNYLNLGFELILPNARAEEVSRGSVVCAVRGDEVLVGVPGGHAGCHALYSIFENILRNAAKYGAWRGQTDLKLSFTLIDKGSTDSYVLEIRDSLGAPSGSISEKKEIEVVRRLRVCMNEWGDSETERTVHHGRGTHEVRACAKFLAGCTFKGGCGSRHHCVNCFESDKDVLKRGGNDSYSEYLKCHARDLRRHDGRRKTAWFESPTPIRCWYDGKGIVYAIRLPKPRLVSLLDENTGVASTGDNDLRYTQVVASLKRMAEYGPSFGIVLDRDHNSDNVKAILNDVVKHDACLPFRLFCVCSEERYGFWTLELQKFSINFPWIRKRFRIVVDGRLHNRLSIRDKPQEWLDTIRMIYAAWLRAFKRPPNGADRWHLMVGFDRGADTIGKRWDAVSSALRNTVVHVHVVADGILCRTTLDADPGKVKCNNKGVPCVVEEMRGACIVFDNHGILFDDTEREGLAFWQMTSGSKNIDLFQCLETPPTGVFGFEMMVNGLVESALLDIAVLDERLSEFVAGESNPSNAAGELHYARIYPVNQIEGCTTSFASCRAQKVEEKLANPHIFGTIRLQGEAKNCISIPGLLDGNIREEVDLLLVHLGVLEQCELPAKISARCNLDALRHLTSATLVLTSGRGGATGEWGREVRFADFSSLGNALIGNLNKYKIGRVVVDAKHGDTKS